MNKFTINPVLDLPVDEAKLLGHEKIVRYLKEFLESEQMVSPLSIAIHGEWGSGKTSIMKTLEKNLDNEKTAVLFFESWKYEYSNPSLGLMGELAVKFSTAEDSVEQFLNAAAFVLTKFLGFDSREFMQVVQGERKSLTENLSEKLKKILKRNLQGKKFIILIDDLDRCDVENSLQMLSVLKLFLDIKNVICIAAIDYKRLENAWLRKYVIFDETHQSDAKQYLDKIFQIRITVPYSTSDFVSEYVDLLVPDINPTLRKIFSELGPRNPRSIKRLLNLISYRMLVAGDTSYVPAILWTLLEHVIGTRHLIALHATLKNKGGNLADIIQNEIQWDSIQTMVRNTGSNNLKLDDVRKFFSLSQQFVKEINLNSRLDIGFQRLYLFTKEYEHSNF